MDTIQSARVPHVKLRKGGDAGGHKIMYACPFQYFFWKIVGGGGGGGGGSVRLFGRIQYFLYFNCFSGINAVRRKASSLTTKEMYALLIIKCMTL